MTKINSPFGSSPQPRNRDKLWHSAKTVMWAILGCFLLVHVSCSISEMVTGERVPRYVYTDTRTDLVFDGERIVIEGRTECRRLSGSFSNGISLDFLRRSHYSCGPNWFAHPLDEDGVLLVSSYAVRDDWPTIFDVLGNRWPPKFGGPDLRHHYKRLKNRPQAVVWIDDPDNPTHGEAYFSTAHFKQPGARLTSIESKILSVDDRTYFPKTYSHPEEIVPSLRESGSPPIGRGHYAILVPRETWSHVPGLEEILSRYNEPVLINAVEQLSEEQRKAFRKAANLQNVSWSYYMVHAPEEAEANKYPRYDQSKRTVPLVLDPDGAYRLDRSQQRGRLLFYAQPYQKSFRVRIGDREFAEHTDGYPYRFYYDPEFKEIIILDPF